MNRFIVSWNAGYGTSYDEVEAETEAEAREIAYELWKEEVESNAEYDVIGEWTEELEEEFL